MRRPTIFTRTVTLFPYTTRFRSIEDAAADLFAEQRRTGADAKIDCLGLGDVQLDTTILRHAALSQIKARHHLDASRETPRHRLWRGRDRLQLAILAVADTIGFLVRRSEEHTYELQSLMRISSAVFCLKKKKYTAQQKG